MSCWLASLGLAFREKKVDRTIVRCANGYASYWSTDRTMSRAFCGPVHELVMSIDSLSEWAPLSLPPPPMVMAGIPRLMGRLESEEPALVSGCPRPRAWMEALAVVTRGESAGVWPAGRIPM